ncbi:MAG: Uma2 family endonuclease [bacterium]|nr:Uma2 family endonuclease [bacterium]
MAISPAKISTYTLDEFEALIQHPENADRLLELIDGELREKMPTFEHGMIAGNLITLINNDVIPRKLGRAAVEARHQLPPDQQDAQHPYSRMPYVSYISRESGLPPVRKGAVRAMPDLAVEIQSPIKRIKL